MAYEPVDPQVGDDLTEEYLDRLARNGAFVHEAVQVLPLHAGHIANMSWPVDILVDETTLFTAVPAPSYPFYPRIYRNIRVDGLREGIHRFSLVGPQMAYRFRWFKTQDINFMTLWLVHYSGNIAAVTVNLLGHAQEEANWT